MSDAVPKVHRASPHRPEHAKQKGTFRTLYTVCSVTPGMKRLATNRASDVTCAKCSGKARKSSRKEKPKVQRSIVTDQPGHPVAAPCTIEYCQYFKLEKDSQELRKIAEQLFQAAASANDRPMIRVWRFEDAPTDYQALSRHGGDEDWVALVPAALANSDWWWLLPRVRGWNGEPSEHPQPDGSVVFIGAHA